MPSSRSTTTRSGWTSNRWSARVQEGGPSMDTPEHDQILLPRLNRRTVLKVSGAAGLAAAAGGLEGILAAGTAPAYAQPTKLHLLQWVDFIPEGDVELRRQAAEYSRQAKVDVTVETINANDLQARITAAIQSGTGPDIIQLLHNWPHLYQNALVDLSDLCEWKGRDQGGFYPQLEAPARAGTRGLALPYGMVCALITYPTSWSPQVDWTHPPTP